MSPPREKDPLYGAAILKLSFILNGKVDDPGFRVVYYGTLKELGLTDAQVNAYIRAHRSDLEAQIKAQRNKTG